MAVYLVTGKLGSGKTLAAVGRIREYLRRGAMVATNLDLFMEHMGDPQSRANVHRLPDHPSRDDLDSLGRGQPGIIEEKNGLIVLDECGAWLNARDWSDKGRQSMIDWALHSRKLGWDLMLIVQDISMIDKQIRTALVEFHVIVKRMDRLAIPFVSGIGKLFGLKLHPPKVHAAFVKYGVSLDAPISDRWMYRGHDLYAAYDTRQVFRPAMPMGGVQVPHVGNNCMLSPWHLKGRYMAPVRPAWHVPILLLLLLAYRVTRTPLPEKQTKPLANLFAG